MNGRCNVLKKELERMISSEMSRVNHELYLIDRDIREVENMRDNSLDEASEIKLNELKEEQRVAQETADELYRMLKSIQSMRC